MATGKYHLYADWGYDSEKANNILLLLLLLKTVTISQTSDRVLGTPLTFGVSGLHLVQTQGSLRLT